MIKNKNAHKKITFSLITIFSSSRPSYANQTFDGGPLRTHNPFVNVTRKILGPISVIVRLTIQPAE